MSKANALPQAFSTNRIKRKRFAYDGDVHVSGDVQLGEQLIVGGDLLIDGDLIAEEVYCLGKLTVTGNVQVQSLYVGQALDVAGDIQVEFLLKTACNAEWMARLLEMDAAKHGDNYLDKLVHPKILERNQKAEYLHGLGDIQCMGELRCGDIDCQGDLLVDGMLFANEIIYVGGHLNCAELVVQLDCNCQGEVYSEGDIHTGGDLFASFILAQGNLSAKGLASQSDIRGFGFIRVEGDISSLHGEIQVERWLGAAGNIYAAHYIKAGEAVVAGKQLQVGADYGILAGQSLPRSKWDSLGFISAANKPTSKLILSGQFVEAKKLRHLDALEKKRSKAEQSE